jgi:putative DNA primase/helicase
MSTRTPLPALQCLQERPQWVCWRREERDSGLTKVPYNPRTGREAKSNDPATWTSYAVAQRAYKRSQQTKRPYDGLGYVFRSKGNITGVDLDHCIAPDGTVDAWAQQWIEQLHSYSEYSPSREGVHIYISGTFAKPSGVKRVLKGKRHFKAAIEVYSEVRYFTFTGEHVEGTPVTIEANQETLDALYAEMTVGDAAQPGKKHQAGPQPALSLEDDLLLKKAVEARNGEKFRALYYHGPQGYPSASEADMALCLMLAFWTGRDTARMDRLYRKSVLYREKWDTARSESTYGWDTIHKAAAVCTVVYDPRRTHPQLERDIEQVLQQIAQQQPRLNTPRKRKPYQLTPKEVSTSKVMVYLDMNEYGDALFFAEVFADQVCYDHTAGEWYLWDGHAWKKDATGKIRQLVAGVLGTLYLRAAADLNTAQAELDLKMQALQRDGVKDSDTQMSALKEQYKALAGQISELHSRARALRSAKRMHNVLTFVQSAMGITSDMWDTHAFLLAVPNGVLDLRTGSCHDGNPSDYIRTVCPTEWTDLDTPCPRFEHFLQEIFEDKPAREAIIAFLQRLFGYGITGSTADHVFAILYGEEGRNGKDTLLGTLHDVLGATAGAMSNDVFVAQDKQKGSGAATPHLCDLQGKRLVWGSETRQGDKLNIAQIKHLSGGGDISTRPLYGKDYYTFHPTHKLLLMTNHKPHIDAKEKPAWDRVCLIEFGIRFVDRPASANERQRDATLAGKLKEERSGILAWLVRGCLAWQEQGLAIPEPILIATSKYREEEDSLLLFIQECCIVSPEVSVKAGALYEAYRKWCEDNQFGKGMNGKLFGEEMGKRFTKVEVNGRRMYRGIGLLISDNDSSTLFDEVSRGSGEGTPLPSTSVNPASKANPPDLEDEVSRGCRGSFPKTPRNEQSTPSIRGIYGKDPLHPLLTPSVNFSQSAPEDALQVVEGKGVPSPDPLPTSGESDEGMSLLEVVRSRARGMTKMYWHVPASGYDDAYLPRDEFFQRVEDCLTHGDAQQRASVIAAMREKRFA